MNNPRFGNIREADVSPQPAYFVDGAVGRLVTRLRNLTYTDINNDPQRWLQFVFPLACANEQSNEPQIWVPHRGDYHSLIPQDQVYSFAFFYENNEREQIKDGYFRVSLSLFVWFNRSWYEKTFNIRELLMQAILSDLRYALSQRDYFSDVRIATHRYDVFRDFDFKQTNLGDAPYDAFLLSFRTIVAADCIFQYQQVSDIAEC